MKREDFDNLPNTYYEDRKCLSQFIVLEEEYDDDWDLVDYFDVSYANVDLNDDSFYWVRMNGDEVKRMLESIEEKDKKYRIRYVLCNDSGEFVNVEIKPVAKLDSGTVYFEKDDKNENDQ